MNIRRQLKILYIWYLKKRGDWDTIHEENDITEMLEELVSVKKKLSGKVIDSFEVCKCVVLCVKF